MGQDSGHSAAHDADERVVLDLLAAASRKDLEGIMAAFRADSVYHNMPVAPTVGIDAIRAAMAGFLSVFAVIEMDISSIASRGGVVHTERIERFTKTDGKRGELPVASTFRVEGGKVTLWRDYFDSAAFKRASGIDLLG